MEPVYGTKFGIGPIPEAWMKSWGTDLEKQDARLHLPRPNPFIPTDFALHKDEAWTGPPRVIVHEPGSMRMHHKCDLTFSQPKAYISLELQSPEAYSTPEQAGHRLDSVSPFGAERRSSSPFLLLLPSLTHRTSRPCARLS